MKKSIFLLTLLTSLLTFEGFSQITSDYDKSIDFSKYKTYTFLGWEANSDKQLTPEDKKRIQTAFKNELTARNMTLKEKDGDVDITLYIVIDKNASKSAYKTYNEGLGYSAGAWGWETGMSSSIPANYNDSHYTEGTVVITFFDHASKKKAWQGIMTTEVKEPEQREKSIPKKVNKLMAKYPVKPNKATKK